jgi:hypothetical protein
VSVSDVATIKPITAKTYDLIGLKMIEDTTKTGIPMVKIKKKI